MILSIPPSSNFFGHLQTILRGVKLSIGFLLSCFLVFDVSELHADDQPSALSLIQAIGLIY